MVMFSTITKVNYEEREINNKSIRRASSVTIEYLCPDQLDEVFADKVREEKIRMEQTKKLGYETSLISDMRGVLRWEYVDAEGKHGTRLVAAHVELGGKKSVYF